MHNIGMPQLHSIYLHKWLEYYYFLSLHFLFPSFLFRLLILYRISFITRADYALQEIAPRWRCALVRTEDRIYWSNTALCGRQSICVDYNTKWLLLRTCSICGCAVLCCAVLGEVKSEHIYLDFSGITEHSMHLVYNIEINIYSHLLCHSTVWVCVCVHVCVMESVVTQYLYIGLILVPSST